MRAPSPADSVKKLVATALVVLLPLGGCGSLLPRPLFKEHNPDNQAEAGSTHLAVLSVAPWEDFAKELQPKFAFDEAKALELAAATTQAFEEKVVDALSMMVKLAPPRTETTEEVRKTENLKDAAGKEVPPRTSDRTDKRSSGDLSAVPVTTPGTEAELPGFPLNVASPLTKQLAVEPMLKYAAATALLQEVRLLNRYIEQAVERHDYQAYAVRLQVSLMPSARNEPVDAYTTASFFLGDGSSANLAAPTAFLEMPMGTERGARLFPDLEMAAIRVVLALDSGGSKELALEPCGDLLEELASSSSARDPEAELPVYLDLASSVETGARLRQATETLMEATRNLQELRENAPEKAKLTRELHSSCGDAARFVLAAKHRPSAPFVVPLLVTDDLELSSQARALNEARQFAFGLQVMAQGFGGSLGSSRLARKLQAVTGNDVNSLLTVARLTDNTFRVRFGAMQQASGKYAMVPRTNNVTLLVLVPKLAVVSGEKLGSYLQVLTHTEMVHARTGKKIPPAPLADPARACDALLRPYRSLLGPKVSCDATLAQELMNEVFRNDFSGFEELASDKLSPSIADFPYQQLWLDFATATTHSAYASTNFELPKRRLPEFFCGQTTTLLDDGKSEATVTLRDGRFLSAAALSAVVLVGEKDVAGVCKAPSKHALAATQISPNEDRTSVVVKVPSPSSLGLDPACATEIRVTCRECIVPTSSCGQPSSVNMAVATYALTGLKKKEATPETKVARFTLAPASAALARPGNGISRLRLLFKKTDKRAAALFGFGFVLEGARVTNVAVTAGDPDKPLPVASMAGNPQAWQVITEQEAVTVDVTLEDLGAELTVKAAERLPKVGTATFEDGAALSPLVIPVLSSGAPQ